MKRVRKEAPAGIVIDCERTEQNGRPYFRILLSDNGSVSIRQKIFTTFAQLHSASEYEGTGLGLHCAGKSSGGIKGASLQKAKQAKVRYSRSFFRPRNDIVRVIHDDTHFID